MKRRLLKLSGRIAILLTTIIIMLLLFEGFLRLFYPQELIVLRPDVYYPVEDLGYKHRPNVNTTFNVGERTVHFYTDARGYRIGQQPTLDHADFRILAVGDSFLEALQVEYEEIMTSRLAEQLSQQTGQTVTVVNTGVSGYDPNHYRAITHDELARNNYDLVIVFIYVANDIVSTDVDTISPLAPTLRHDLRLPDDLSRAEITDSILYPVSDFLEANSHLYIAVRNASDIVLARLGLTGAYFPHVLLKSQADSADWAVTAQILNDINRTAAIYDTPILFVLLPAAVQVDDEDYEWYQTAFDIDPADVNRQQPYQILSSQLAAYEIDLIDTAPALRLAYESGEDNLYGDVHKHFNAPAHQVVAEVLTPVVLAMMETESNP